MARRIVAATAPLAAGASGAKPRARTERCRQAGAASRGHRRHWDRRQAPAARGAAVDDDARQLPFDFVAMNGDNIYGGNADKDYANKSETRYKSLLDGGVKFYAVARQSRQPNERFYKPFNMNGELYYTFKPSDGVRFFALDSNYMDRASSSAWSTRSLRSADRTGRWCFFHHPFIRRGAARIDACRLDTARAASSSSTRGCRVVGHDHFYERIKPQIKGIAYFIAGSSAKPREGKHQWLTSRVTGLDTGYMFMVIEIVGDEHQPPGARRHGGRRSIGARTTVSAKGEPTPN